MATTFSKRSQLARDPACFFKPQNMITTLTLTLFSKSSHHLCSQIQKTHLANAVHNLPICLDRTSTLSCPLLCNIISSQHIAVLCSKHHSSLLFWICNYTSRKKHVHYASQAYKVHHYSYITAFLVSYRLFIILWKYNYQVIFVCISETPLQEAMPKPLQIVFHPMGVKSLRQDKRHSSICKLFNLSSIPIVQNVMNKTVNLCAELSKTIQ